MRAATNCPPPHSPVRRMQLRLSCPIGSQPVLSIPSLMARHHMDDQDWAWHPAMRGSVAVRTCENACAFWPPQHWRPSPPPLRWRKVHSWWLLQRAPVLSAMITWVTAGSSDKQIAATKSFNAGNFKAILFILAEGAIALSVTLSGGALFAS